MNDFGENAVRGQELPERGPARRRHAGFFGQFADGAELRRFALVQFAGGNFPEEISHAVPVLAHHADAPGRVHGNHGRGAGVPDEVQVILAAVA